MAITTQISRKRPRRRLEEGAELNSIRRAIRGPEVSQNKLVGREGGLVVLDHAPRDIHSSPVPSRSPIVIFPDSSGASSSDLLYLLLDVLGARL